MLLLMYMFFLWNIYLVNGVIIANQYKIDIEMAARIVVAKSDLAQVRTHIPRTQLQFMIQTARYCLKQIRT